MQYCWTWFCTRKCCEHRCSVFALSVLQTDFNVSLLPKFYRYVGTEIEDNGFVAPAYNIIVDFDNIFWNGHTWLNGPLISNKRWWYHGPLHFFYFLFKGCPPHGYYGPHCKVPCVSLCKDRTYYKQKSCFFVCHF